MFVFILIYTYFIIEFAIYVWHRIMSHLGYGGDIFRNEHYEHHEIHYPFGKLETDKYVPDGWIDGDTWPWFIPMSFCIMSYIMLYKFNVISLMDCIVGLSVGVLYGYATTYINQAYHIKNHWLNGFEWFRRHKFYHKLHHYYNCNYGITTFTMDRIFGTLIVDFTRPKENIFADYSYNKK